MDMPEQLVEVVKVSNGFKPMKELADRLANQHTDKELPVLAHKLFESKDYQIRMVAVFLFGKLAANFGDALDKDGNPVEFSQVEVVGMVDTTTPGTYSIEYRYGGVSKTILITVKAKDSNTTEGRTSGNGANNNENSTESTNQSTVDGKTMMNDSVSSQKSTEKPTMNRQGFPNTGEKTNVFLSIFGIVFLLTGILFIKRQRAH